MQKGRPVRKPPSKIEGTRLRSIRTSPLQLLQSGKTQLRSALNQPSKKIEDAKLARGFRTTLHEFQKAQQLPSERESAHSPYLPPQLMDSNLLVSPD
ncbi:hypothetical protein DKX38_003496 [Salix brachista]|uniref:Uncharacterized protein n=1 Tax=Salix brachista TaxID=2182728 RepID=A0A5N5NS89_9ROSI|nr:hypothetical protein DKX38_003496 [Salix brachista]